MRRRLLLALVAWTLAVAAPAPSADDGSARLLVERADGTQVWFEVELARSAETRRTGLMERSALPDGTGMWFDFGAEQAVTMWMKNTLIALDMVFVDAGGVVVGVHHRAVPGSLDLIRAPRPVRYVLEISGGAARRLGLAAGDRASLVGAP
ncbi:MAG: DUF192 domain-containing protein [Gammaproteobacteria bacterium]|nr:DUF192 domain-containing protein [Gammaproteobacteria bacterium]